MDVNSEPRRSRMRWLVAIGGAVATGLAAGAGLARRRRRQQDEAELWAEARRVDLPSPAASQEPGPVAPEPVRPEFLEPEFVEPEFVERASVESVPAAADPVVPKHGAEVVEPESNPDGSDGVGDDDHGPAPRRAAAPRGTSAGAGQPADEADLGRDPAQPTSEHELPAEIRPHDPSSGQVF